MTTGLKTTSLEGNAFVYIRHLDDGEIRSLLPPEALDDVAGNVVRIRVEQLN